MAQHDDLEFFRCSRPKPKTDQLENTLKHDVAKGNHGTSSKTAEKGHYFTQTGLKHPSGCVVRSGGEDDVCCGHLKGDSSELALRVKKIHAAWN